MWLVEDYAGYGTIAEENDLLESNFVTRCVAILSEVVDMIMSNYFDGVILSVF